MDLNSVITGEERSLKKGRFMRLFAAVLVSLLVFIPAFFLFQGNIDGRWVATESYSLDEEGEWQNDFDEDFADEDSKDFLAIDEGNVRFLGYQGGKYIYRYTYLPEVVLNFKVNRFLLKMEPFLNEEDFQEDYFEGPYEDYLLTEYRYVRMGDILYFKDYKDGKLVRKMTYRLMSDEEWAEEEDFFDKLSEDSENMVYGESV